MRCIQCSGHVVCHSACAAQSAQTAESPSQLELTRNGHSIFGNAVDPDVRGSLWMCMPLPTMHILMNERVGSAGDPMVPGVQQTGGAAARCDERGISSARVYQDKRN